MSASLETLPETPEKTGGGWLIFSIDELKGYQALPCCLGKPVGGMPELIDKDNAESQLLQAPPGRRGGTRGRGASTGGPSTSTNRSYPSKQPYAHPGERKKFESQSGNRNNTKESFVNDRAHQRPSTGRHRDVAVPTGGEGLNKFTLGDIRKAESTIEKSSMSVGEYVKKVARGEISGDASPVKRGGPESISIFEQVSTATTMRGSNRMSEWLKPRQQEPVGVDTVEQRKLKAGLPKGAVTLEELEKGAKPTAVIQKPSGDGSNEAGRALLAMIGGGGGAAPSSGGKASDDQQLGVGSVHDETLKILREQQQLRSNTKQRGDNTGGAEQMKRLQRQLAQVRTKGQVAPSDAMARGQKVSPRSGNDGMGRRPAAEGAYVAQASQYAQQRAALNQGFRGNMPMQAATPVMPPPPPMGVYGGQASMYGGMMNPLQNQQQAQMQVLLQQLQQQQKRQEQQYDPHQMARRQQHQQMAATAAAAAAATRGQRGGFQPQQGAPYMPAPGTSNVDPSQAAQCAQQ